MYYIVDDIAFYFCRQCDQWVSRIVHDPATPAQVAEIKRLKDENAKMVYVPND
jgi:ribosomal protein L2